MTPRTEKSETYREQITRIVQALAAVRCADVSDDVAEGTLAARVKMFAEDNVDKRFDKLQQQVAFVRDAMGNLDELLEQYVRLVPLAAYDTGASDGEGFLNWLERTQQPVPEERDYIACQRARHAVEQIARRNRWSHVRFQELWSMADELADELATNRTLRVHANPIRAWTRFETQVLLDSDAAVPADVLFFPVGNNIHTALLEPEGQSRFRELCGLGGTTLDRWRAELAPYAGQEGVTQSDLAQFCRDLSEVGLVAFS